TIGVSRSRAACGLRSQSNRMRVISWLDSTQFLLGLSAPALHNRRLLVSRGPGLAAAREPLLRLGGIAAACPVIAKLIESVGGGESVRKRRVFSRPQLFAQLHGFGVGLPGLFLPLRGSQRLRGYGEREHQVSLVIVLFRILCLQLVKGSGSFLGRRNRLPRTFAVNQRQREP